MAQYKSHFITQSNPINTAINSSPGLWAGLQSLPQKVAVLPLIHCLIISLCSPQTAALGPQVMSLLCSHTSHSRTLPVTFPILSILSALTGSRPLAALQSGTTEALELSAGQSMARPLAGGPSA